MQSHDEQGILVVELDKEFSSLDDEHMRLATESLLRAVGQAEKALLLDFEETEYFGSSFMELLVRAASKIRLAKRKIALCNVRSYLLDVLERTRLCDIIPIYESKEEAIAALVGES